MKTLADQVKLAILSWPFLRYDCRFDIQAASDVLNGGTLN